MILKFQSSIGSKLFEKMMFRRFFLKFSKFLENDSGRGSCPSSYPSGNLVDGLPFVAINFDVFFKTISIINKHFQGAMIFKNYFFMVKSTVVQPPLLARLATVSVHVEPAVNRQPGFRRELVEQSTTFES